MEIYISDEAKEWFEWRDRERRKHRVMSFGEYHIWCKAGDSLGFPAESNPFPGGLTLTFGRREDTYLGRVVDE